LGFSGSSGIRIARPGTTASPALTLSKSREIGLS